MRARVCAAASPHSQNKEWLQQRDGSLLLTDELASGSAKNIKDKRFLKKIRDKNDHKPRIFWDNNPGLTFITDDLGPIYYRVLVISLVSFSRGEFYWL